MRSSLCSTSYCSCRLYMFDYVFVYIFFPERKRMDVSSSIVILTATCFATVEAINGLMWLIRKQSLTLNLQFLIYASIFLIGTVGVFIWFKVVNVYTSLTLVVLLGMHGVFTYIDANKTIDRFTHLSVLTLATIFWAFLLQ
jgi:hypothetical protein